MPNSATDVLLAYLNGRSPAAQTFTLASVSLFGEKRGLGRSYAAHRDAATKLTNGPTRAMLSFYSVECGMKAVLVDDRAYRSTQQLDGALAKTHDLRVLSKELRLSPQLQGVPADCRRKNEFDPRVAADDLHAAWRYGVVLNADDERTALEWIADLSNWCAERLGI